MRDHEHGGGQSKHAFPQRLIVRALKEERGADAEENRNADAPGATADTSCGRPSCAVGKEMATIRKASNPSQ